MKGLWACLILILSLPAVGAEDQVADPVTFDQRFTGYTWEAESEYYQRQVREIQQNPGVVDWVKKYKADPTEIWKKIFVPRMLKGKDYCAVIHIDLACNELYMYSMQKDMETHMSSGGDGWRTEDGGKPHDKNKKGSRAGKCWTPISTERLHISKAHGNAKMPYSVFFLLGEDGVAIHEGNPYSASHGCIHLSHEQAVKVYTAVDDCQTRKSIICLDKGPIDRDGNKLAACPVKKNPPKSSKPKKISSAQ